MTATLPILLALLAAEPAPQSATAILTVRQFGARGDGQADDTAAIQRAADQGGEIRFPAGTYRISRPVVIELDRTGYASIVADGTASLRMAGPGPALKLIGTHAGTASPDSVKENVWQRQRTPMIDGLEIVGEHPEAIGLWLEGVFQPVITRVAVRNALHGICLTRRARNAIISNCHLYHNQGVGLLLEGLSLHQVNIDNCHISYNAGGGIVVRTSEIRNLQIAACDIEANMHAGAPPAANILLDASEGSIREGAIVGCTLQHGREPAGGANIRLVGRSVAEPQKVGFFSIAGNQISDTGVNIHLLHARGVSITGNTFFLGHEYNLLAEDCSQLVIGANLFDRNPDYPPGSRDGLMLADCRDSTLSGLQVTAAAEPQGALILRRCRRINVAGCTILDCDGCGILLEDADGVRVSGCLVRDDRPSEEPPLALRLSGRGNMVVGNMLMGKTDIAAGGGLVNNNYGGD